MNNHRPGRGNMDTSFKVIEGGPTQELVGRVERWIINHCIVDVTKLEFAFECHFDGCIMFRKASPAHMQRFSSCHFYGCGFEGPWPPHVIQAGTMTDLQARILRMNTHRLAHGAAPLPGPEIAEGFKPVDGLIVPRNTQRGTAPRQQLIVPPNFRLDPHIGAKTAAPQPPANPVKGTIH